MHNTARDAKTLFERTMQVVKHPNEKIGNKINNDGQQQQQGRPPKKKTKKKYVAERKTLNARTHLGKSRCQ